MIICPRFNKVVTMEGLLHVGHVWPGIVPQQGVHGHDDARCAEPTLGAVSLRYSLLQHTHAGTHEAKKNVETHSTIICQLFWRFAAL